VRPRRSSRPRAPAALLLAPLLLSLLGLGCATLSSGETAGSEAVGPDVARVEIDPALPAEVVALTRDLVRAGHAGRDEGASEVVRLLEERLRKEPGLETVSAAFGEQGRRNLKVRLPGTDASQAPVLLLAHAGVFPAEAARWSEDAPPFEAVTRGEHLVGRGVLDMLGPTALAAMTLVALTRSEVPLARDVLLIVTADDEGRSAALEQALIDWPEIAKAEVALTEGGFVLEDFFRAGEDVVALAWAEKGRLALRLTTRAARTPAHRAPALTASGRLARALDRVRSFDSPARPTGLAVRTAAALARTRGGRDALLANNDALVRRFVVGKLEEDPWTRPMLSHGCTITRMTASDLERTSPAEASATVECGVLPGASPSDVRDALLLAIADPRVDVEVAEAVPPSASAPVSGATEIIHARLDHERAGIALVPFVLARPTGAGALRAHGVPVYGFTPLAVDRDELSSALGSDERVRVRELEDALSRLVDITSALANTQGAIGREAIARAR